MLGREGVEDDNEEILGRGILQGMVGSFEEAGEERARG